MGQIKRGEIYSLKNGGGDVPRPAVVVSRDALNRGDAVIMIPFYSQQLEKRKEQDWCVLFYVGEGGLDRESVAKTDNISFINKSEINLDNKIGEFNSDQMLRLEEGMKWSLFAD